MTNETDQMNDNVTIKDSTVMSTKDMNSDNTIIINTVCYLSYFYAGKDSTNMKTILKDEYPKLDKQTLLAGLTKWKQVLQEYNIGELPNSTTTTRATLIKALLNCAELTKKNESVVNLVFYPEFKDMDMVISHYDNTAVMRT